MKETLTVSDYRLALFDKNEYDKWDLFVDESPQGTLFHETWWLTLSGDSNRIFGCYDNNNELVAGFTCGETKVYGLFNLLGPGLYNVYQGVLYKNITGKYVTRLSRNKHIGYEIAKAIKTRCSIANITFSPFEMEDVMPFIWAGFTTSVKYTYVLNLQDMDTVWNNMDLDCRNGIRKAKKDGISIDIGCDFEQSLKLAKGTYDRQNIKLSEQSHLDALIPFHNMAKSLSRCKSFIARSRDGVPIAVTYIIWDKKRSYYILGAYDHKNAHHGATSLALWTALEYTRNELGLCEFDFEGTMLYNVEPFFRQFGSRLTPYYNVTWVDKRLKPLFVFKRLIKETLESFGSEKR